MSEFLYIYRRPPHSMSPQQMQDHVQRWRTWFDGLKAGGHLADLGLPLEPTAGAVVRDAAGTFTDGPYAETKDMVIGYSVISADDIEHAIRLTAGWPGFDEGGLVEVRPITRI
jgi:hypothetical protein